MAKDIEDRLRAALIDATAHSRTLNSIAVQAGISHVVLRKFRDGAGTITLTTAAKLAKALGLTLE